MKPIDRNAQDRYFSELSICLGRKGLGTLVPENGLLSVTLDDRPFCQITAN